MLMPSALSCDSSHPPVTRLQTALFASPPASPPTTAQSAIGNIFTTCRALQSMLTAPAMISVSSEDQATRSRQLPTPPLTHATLPPAPLKLRLRPRRLDSNGEPATPRKRIVKRSAPPRGVNKRRRAVEDDLGRDDDIDSELDIDATDVDGEGEDEESAHSCGPRTPKRARIAPQVMPLGLERSDFHNLQTATEGEERTEEDSADVEVEGDGEAWSTEDDRILVELVLEKLKLSKSEWQDCARSLGKDRKSLDRRWKSLMVNGDVGLRSRSRRSRIHGTWR